MFSVVASFLGSVRACVHLLFLIMLLSLKYTFRSLLNRKFYTVINVCGLAIGMAICLILVSYVHLESSYDHYHQKSHRTYKLISQLTNQHGNTSSYSLVLGDVNEVLLHNVPEIEQVTLLYGRQYVEVDAAGKRFNSSAALYVDYSFIEIFDFDGSGSINFTHPDQVIISQDFAQRAFSEDPLGQLLYMKGQAFKIAGVVTIPKSTQFSFNILFPLDAFPDLMQMKSEGLEFESYLTLSELGNTSETVDKIAAVYNQFMVNKWPLYTAENFLIPLQEVYLDDRVNHQLGNGNSAMLMIYVLVALLIVVLAMINYLNIQIVHSYVRQAEMKARKVLGASLPDLISLSFVESFIVMVSSAGLALVLVELISGANRHSSVLGLNDLSLQVWSWMEWTGFGVILMVLVIISTLFITRRLSNLKIHSSIKSMTLGKTTLALIVFQFFITAGLLSVMLFISSQMNYLQSFNKGYEEENVLIIQKLNNQFKKNYPLIKNELMNHPSISAVSGMQAEPGSGTSGQVIRKASDSEDQEIIIDHVRMIDGYLETFRLQLVAGEGFSTTDAYAGSYQFVLNETAVNKLFTKAENPIGQQLNMSGRLGVVVGVVADYHYRSLRYKIEPLVIDIEEPYYLKLAVRFHSVATTDAIEHIAKTLQGYDQDYQLNYTFLEEQFGHVYRSELDSKKILGYATIVAFAISLFGLLSMTIFIIKTKTKEMAMRKILGADMQHMFWHLSKNTFYCILVGNILAIPVTYWFAEQWVTGFVFHVSVVQLLWIMPMCLLVSLAVAFLVVVYQLWKALLVNPVHYLRYE